MKLRFYTFLLLLFLLFFKINGYSQDAPPGRQTITITEGSSVILRANSVGASTYIWFKDGILIPGQNKPTLVTATAGFYKVASINKGGCTSDLSEDVQILVVPGRSADVSITKRSASKTVVKDEVFEYYLNVRNNGADDATGLVIEDKLPEYLSFESLAAPTDGTADYDPALRTVKWKIDGLVNGKFAELVIKVRSKQMGLVSNTATVSANEADPNLSNNTSTDNKEISGLRIPNVFTPNGDGKNETFYLEHLNSYQFNEVTIINRWGSTVYQTSDYKNDWTAPGLSDGTYFYVVKVKNGNTDWMAYKGYVTVIR